MGKKKTQTTTQNATNTTSYPQWTQDAQRQAAAAGAALSTPFINVPSYQLAGFNADQQRAFDLARETAQRAHTNLPHLPNENVGYEAAQVRPAVMATAQQIDSSNIPGHMNPFLQSVIDPAVQQARRGLRETHADIGARSAAAASFGGSREALQRAQANRAYGENVTSTVANLMAQGYDRATGLEATNMQARQQAEMANAAAQNQAQLQQAAYEQQANMATPQYELARAQTVDNILAGHQARERASTQDLLNVGNQQQLFGQEVLNVPYTNLSRLLSLIPPVYNTTQTQQSKSEQPDNSPGVGQQVLGAGLTLGSKFLFSDRRAKMNVEELGTDPRTGLRMYAYDYIADVEAAQREGRPMGSKRVGPMAQDVEAAYPGSTRMIGNSLVIEGA